MKKNIFFLILLAFCIQTNAQQNIGIGTTTPHSSSLLDVRSNNKGMLVPRINLTSETDVVTIAAPATSLLVYNTNNALTDGEGFYFWNGNKWSKLVTRGNLNELTWGITGNSGTIPDSNFIGTTDNKALVFKTNKILSGKIDPLPRNVFFGQSAGRSHVVGSNNTLIGHNAGAIDTSGYSNVFIGSDAGSSNSSGVENVFIGEEAGVNNNIGSRNTIVGEDAGEQNKRGEDNVFIGNLAGKINKNGNRNIIIGSAANLSDSNFVNATAIGYNAMVSNDNTVVVGNADVVRWRLGTEPTPIAPPPFVAFIVGWNLLNGNGAFLSTGGVWVNTSDSSKKEQFSQINKQDLLQKILQLDIQQWKYKGTDEFHIGPIAQQFYNLFNIGVNDKSISTIDPAGIALAAIQEQQRMIENQNEMINELKKEMMVLKQTVLPKH